MMRAPTLVSKYNLMIDIHLTIIYPMYTLYIKLIYRYTPGLKLSN